VSEYALRQNYPNPFNPATEIVFELKEAGHVKLTVYNAMGQEVAALMNAQAAQGRHSVRFAANDLPSGVYLCRMTTAGFTAQIKMLLMK
jgi:hypothetical protein